MFSDSEQIPTFVQRPKKQIMKDFLNILILESLKLKHRRAKLLFPEFRIEINC